MAIQEHRRFKRIATSRDTRIRSVQVSSDERHRIEQIRNLSIGGVFVETGAPMRIGSVVELHFTLPGHEGEVGGRGVVRWSNDGSIRTQPRGMGIEFLEVFGGKAEALRAFVRAKTEQEFMGVLTRSRHHENLLRFYCRKQGENFPIDVLARFLGCRHAEMLECLKDFSLYALLRFSRDTVTFVKASDPEVAAAIQVWYDTIQHGLTPGGGTPRPE